MNNCTVCECPHGFGGQFCTEVESPTVQMANCGGVLEAVVGKEQTYTGKLKSEIWQKFMVEKCYWHIRVRLTNAILLREDLGSRRETRKSLRKGAGSPLYGGLSVECDGSKNGQVPRCWNQVK